MYWGGVSVNLRNPDMSGQYNAVSHFFNCWGGGRLRQRHESVVFPRSAHVAEHLFDGRKFITEFGDQISNLIDGVNFTDVAKIPRSSIILSAFRDFHCVTSDRQKRK